jgi:hypothetical protein
MKIEEFHAVGLMRFPTLVSLNGVIAIPSMVSSPAQAGDPVARSTSIEMRVSGLLDAPLSTEVGPDRLRQLSSERNRKHPIPRGMTPKWNGQLESLH